MSGGIVHDELDNADDDQDEHYRKYDTADDEMVKFAMFKITLSILL